jgi:translation initiation factor IF-1
LILIPCQKKTQSEFIMVKNTKGGSGHKAMARKFASVNSSTQKTRVSQDEMEVYASVIRMVGGINCVVKCVDGSERLCVIRGKFRGGRGKRNNLLSPGVWVLVGSREWSSEDSSDKEGRKCDLLEVYNDADKQELKKNRSVKWDIIDQVTAFGTAQSQADDFIQFGGTEYQDEYEELMQMSGGAQVTLKGLGASRIQSIKEEDKSDYDDDDVVNVDDI